MRTRPNMWSVTWVVQPAIMRPRCCTPRAAGRKKFSYWRKAAQWPRKQGGSRPRPWSQHRRGTRKREPCRGTTSPRFAAPVTSGTSAGSGVAAFHQNAQTIDRGVPLIGNLIEATPQFREAFATRAIAAHEAGLLERHEMLGDGLARELGAFREPHDGLRPIARQARHQPQARGVAQGGEERRRFGEAGSRPMRTHA